MCVMTVLHTVGGPINDSHSRVVAIRYGSSHSNDTMPCMLHVCQFLVSILYMLTQTCVSIHVIWM